MLSAFSIYIYTPHLNHYPTSPQPCSALIWEGQWKADKKHGPGILTYASGAQRQCTYNYDSIVKSDDTSYYKYTNRCVTPSPSLCCYSLKTTVMMRMSIITSASLCFLLFLFIYSSLSISFSFHHYTLIVIITTMPLVIS